MTVPMKNIVIVSYTSKKTFYLRIEKHWKKNMEENRGKKSMLGKNRTRDRYNYYLISVQIPFLAYLRFLKENHKYKYTILKKKKSDAAN